MLPHDIIDAADGQRAAQGKSPSYADVSSTQASWSPAVSPKAHSFDEIVPHRPNQPLPSSTFEFQRRSHSSPAFSSARVASPVPNKPHVILDMPLIQARAEMIELQMRRDREETQRMEESHIEEMVDSKGFRVTHACEHCRQRKAKCSGQQPCQRCAKQGILCIYSRHERRGRTVGPRPMHNFIDVPSQSSRHPMLNLVSALPSSGAGMPGGGPMRVERSREVRYSNMSVPYGLRRNTAPSALFQYMPVTREGASSSSLLPPLPPPPPPQQQYQQPAGPSSWPLLPPTTRELRGQSPHFPGQQGMHLQILRAPPRRCNTSSPFEERSNSGPADALHSQSLLQSSQLMPRPWTSEGAVHPSDDHLQTRSMQVETQPQLPSRFGPVTPRTLAQSAAATGVPRPMLPLPSSPLHGVWSEDTSVTPDNASNLLAASSSPGREASHQPMYLDQPAQAMPNHSLQDEWSVDTALSHIARRGSLSTEGERSHGSNLPEMRDRAVSFIEPEQEKRTNECDSLPVEQSPESQWAQDFDEDSIHT